MHLELPIKITLTVKIQSLILSSMSVFKQTIIKYVFNDRLNHTTILSCAAASVAYKNISKDRLYLDYTHMCFCRYALRKCDTPEMNL